MDFMEISKKRVTVRKFSQRPVEEEKVNKILEAGRWSPTAVNKQPQRILVLNTPESLAKVREFCSFGYDQKYVELAKECDDKETGRVNFYYGAPLVLFVAYDKTACWVHPQSGKSSGVTDATIVATHMMLEAWELGLGSVWVRLFDVQAVTNAFRLPSYIKPICLLPVGYATEDSAPYAPWHDVYRPIEEFTEVL